MKKLMYLAILFICFSCEPQTKEIETPKKNTGVLIIDSTTLSASGFIVDGVEVGKSYIVKKGFDGHDIKISTPYKGLGFSHDGWVMEQPNKFKWVNYCGQWFCRDITLIIPKDSVTTGVYKYRYTYTDTALTIRYFTKPLVLTVN